MDARYEVRQLQMRIAELRKRVCDEKRDDSLDELVDCLDKAEADLDAVVGDMLLEEEDEDEDDDEELY